MNTVIITPEDTPSFVVYEDGQKIGELKPADPEAWVEVFTKGGATVQDCRAPVSDITPL